VPVVSLIPIDGEGAPLGFDGKLPEFASQVLEATANLYKSVGFEEPWVGYLAVENLIPVGTCGFKSAPRDKRVEIAYFTFPEFEGRGLATAMARELVAIAQRHEPGVVVAAQTLPERNASHRVLEKLGFEVVETIDHPDDGMVLEWQFMLGAGT